MEKYISLDTTYALPFVEEKALHGIQKEVNKARRVLENKTGEGNDFLGWVNLPKEVQREEILRLINVGKRIRKQSKVLVVIGIGGSYLGAKAALEYLNEYFPKRRRIEVVFAGHQMSSTYLNELLQYLEKKDFSINVISKSGTTTEPAIAFRLLKKLLIKKYGEEGSKTRIYATTDQSKGALRKLADENQYESFIVPDDVGGRYSVLTPVGLLPMAAAGIDIAAMIRGAKHCMKAYRNPSLDKNDLHLYVALRNLFYRDGKKIEMLVNYEPKLNYFAEWWKQLFGESEGKDHLGLFPASAAFTTDLHSLGQYVQDGERLMFETVLNIEQPSKEVIIEADDRNLDGLNYLQGKTLDMVNKQALKGTLMAHVDGGVPNLVINIPALNAYSFGYLAYFFELACGVSGYLLGVNPFNQPGVEAYKKNMFALLGKDGYESLRKKLLG